MIDLKMKGKIIIKGKIKACTGLHIGGSPTGLEIGGVDNSVVKDQEGKPYIPGSSLRGKMRSLLEKGEGLATGKGLLVVKEGNDNERIRLHMCNEENCPVCIIFGRTNMKDKTLADGSKISIDKSSPARLIVRDAYLIESSITEKMKSNMDMEWTEVKYENTLDRITSAANPRQSERVPRGAQFAMQMVYTIYDEQDKEFFSKVIKAMGLLEDDYLGGSGTRGYGQICFEDLTLYWNSIEDYEKGNINLEKKDPWLKAGNLQQLGEELNKPETLEKIKF